MMDKPEGIEQRDWDDACEAMDRAGWYMRSVRVECAKAINQARSQACEECAKIADAHGNNWTGSRDIETAINDSAKDDMAEAISQAIRQHSQKGKSE